MEPNKECPRFDRCSVNNCPLTAKYPNWSVSPEDAESKCTLGKSKRFSIGSGTCLNFKGLTPREFHAMERQESLTPEQRQKQVEIGHKNAVRYLKRGSDQKAIIGHLS